MHTDAVSLSMIGHKNSPAASDLPALSDLQSINLVSGSLASTLHVDILKTCVSVCVRELVCARKSKREREYMLVIFLGLCQSVQEPPLCVVQTLAILQLRQQFIHCCELVFTVRAIFALKLPH